MALDFDQFPTDDPLIKHDTDYMHPVWIAFMTSFIETLGEYLSQYGMFVPLLTTAQKAEIQNPQIGQMIYETTLDQLQIYKTGGWTVIV